MENPDPDPPQQPNLHPTQQPNPDPPQQPNPDQRRQHVCKRCGKVLAHQSSKSRHEKSCILKINPVSKVKKTYVYVCTKSWCNADFGKVGNRNRHSLTCHKKKIKPKHICTTCGKVFEKESKLLRHQPSHDKPLFTCNWCFSTFKSEKRFQTHRDEKCQPPSSTRTSALDDMPTLVGDNLQNDDTCENDDTLGTNDETSDENYFTAVAQWFDSEGSHPCPSSLSGKSCTSSSFVDDNIAMNVPSPPCPSSPIDAGTSVSSHPCSSSFVEGFSHIQINSNGTATSISTETPSVYVLEDEDLHNYQMFESMDFLHASPSSPSYSKEHSYTMEQFERTVTDCTIKHLKSLKHKAKRSSVMQREFASLCILLFKKRADEEEFMNSLAAELGLSREELFTKADHIFKYELLRSHSTKNMVKY